jgi:septal ring factor EnvC (AmiA/AmiB activator)
MKKILLAFIVCCAFSVYAIATNSNAKLNNIEMIEKKINALKAERANIENKRSPIIKESEIYIKKMEEFKNKTKIPNTFSEKVENDIRGLKCALASMKLELDINKIDVNIDKANIELIKAEIKAGKTSKIPLELANAVLKSTKSLSKVIEAENKCFQARIKENEAKIKYLEATIKTQEERKKSATKDLLIKNIELAELGLVEMMLKLEFEKAQEEMARARTNDVEACVKHYYKPLTKLRKTYLKFDKAIDEKNFVSFLQHE